MNKILIGIAAIAVLILIRSKTQKKEDQSSVTLLQKQNRVINFYKA